MFDIFYFGILLENTLNQTAIHFANGTKFNSQTIDRKQRCVLMVFYDNNEKKVHISRLTPPPTPTTYAFIPLIEIAGQPATYGAL